MKGKETTGEAEKKGKGEQGDIHAPWKVAYSTEHDPKENKWLRMARERSKGKGT